MTKEEITDKYSEYVVDFGFALSVNDTYTAMDEYAKQQAIAFHGFVIEKFDPHGDNFVSKNSHDDEVYFADEVYKQFIEQQNKP
jgi:hypothetical protein